MNKQAKIALVSSLLIVGILAAVLVFGTHSQCHDNVDNDGDGRIDYPADYGCRSSGDTTESPDPQCGDFVDNDADGKIDYPADFGCSYYYDTTESPNPQCSDGIDNDGDGKIDYPTDLGCYNSYDNTELNSQCIDSIDNDGDGKIDYPADFGCYNTEDTTEAPNPQCSDGVDNNDIDTLIDYPNDPACVNERWSSETGECEDGRDNEFDGAIDYPNDPECTSYNSKEGNCQDTDGGFSTYIRGTVTGTKRSVPYNNTDFCVNATILKEFYCNFPQEQANFTFNCQQNINVTGNLTGMCISGACA